jgi:hypothetical protein
MSELNQAQASNQAINIKQYNSDQIKAQYSIYIYIQAIQTPPVQQRDVLKKERIVVLTETNERIESKEQASDQASN